MNNSSNLFALNQLLVIDGHIRWLRYADDDDVDQHISQRFVDGTESIGSQCYGHLLHHMYPLQFLFPS